MLIETVCGVSAIICGVLLALLCLKRKTANASPIHEQVPTHPNTVVIEANGTGLAVVAQTDSQPVYSVALSKTERKIHSQSVSNGSTSSALPSHSVQNNFDIRTTRPKRPTAVSTSSPYETVDMYEKARFEYEPLTAEVRVENGLSSSQPEKTDAADEIDWALQSQLKKKRASQIDKTSTASVNSEGRKSNDQTTKSSAVTAKFSYTKANRTHRATSSLGSVAPPPLPNRNYRPESLFDNLNGQAFREQDYAVIESSGNRPNASAAFPERTTAAGRLVEAEAMNGHDESYERIATNGRRNEILPYATTYGLHNGDREATVAIAVQHGVTFNDAALREQSDVTAGPTLTPSINNSNATPTYFGITVRESLASLRERNALPTLRDPVTAVYNASTGSEYAQLSDVTPGPTNMPTTNDSATQAAATASGQTVEVEQDYYSAVNKWRTASEERHESPDSADRPTTSSQPRQSTRVGSPYDEIDDEDDLVTRLSANQPGPNLASLPGLPHSDMVSYSTADRLGTTMAFVDDDPYANASDMEPARESEREDSMSAGYARIGNVSTPKSNANPRPTTSSNFRAHDAAADFTQLPAAVAISVRDSHDSDAVGYETIDAMQALRHNPMMSTTL